MSLRKSRTNGGLAYLAQTLRGSLHIAIFAVNETSYPQDVPRLVCNMPPSKRRKVGGQKIASKWRASIAGEVKQFVIYKDADNDWRWRLFAANAKVIADSGEGYKRKADCFHGVRLVAAVAASADIWNGTEEKWEDG